MSFISTKTKTASGRGFTIVELLIVIVVIGILAAITIVSFNGVTAKANTTSAKAAAVTTVKKLEAWNAEKTGYPTAYSGTGNLTDAGQSASSYYLSGVTVSATLIAAQPSTPSTINIFKCVTSSVIVGMQVKYWGYDGTPALQTMNTGDTTSGTCTILAA